MVGVDIDAPSIEVAQTAARVAGLTDRVEFMLAEGEALPQSEPYDAAFAFECLHDMPRPVEVLAAIRSAVRAGWVDGDHGRGGGRQFAAPGPEVDQCMYGFSLFICLPDGMASSPSVGTGTVMRRPVLTDYARRAGFAEVTVLPIEDFGFFRFYRLS